MEMVEGWVVARGTGEAFNLRTSSQDHGTDGSGPTRQRERGPGISGQHFLYPDGEGPRAQQDNPEVRDSRTTDTHSACPEGLPWRAGAGGCSCRSQATATEETRLPTTHTPVPPLADLSGGGSQGRPVWFPLF